LERGNPDRLSARRRYPAKDDRLFAKSRHPAKDVRTPSGKRRREEANADL
jgi:hypothetical protein